MPIKLFPFRWISKKEITHAIYVLNRKTEYVKNYHTKINGKLDGAPFLICFVSVQLIWCQNIIKSFERCWKWEKAALVNIIFFVKELSTTYQTTGF